MASKTKYEMVREHLASVIVSMAPGEQIPTEAALCAELDVSRITVRRAVEVLISDGLLVREQGRGTFVAEPAPKPVVRESFGTHVRGFYRQQADLGNEVLTRVLEITITRDPKAGAHLDLLPDHDLLRLDRIRLIDQVVQQVSTTWLDAARFPRILTHDLSHASLYEFLDEQYQVQLARNDLVVSLSFADQAVAEALQCAQGTPVLAMSSKVFTDDDVPVAYGITHFTPDNSEILISMRNPDSPEPLPAVQIAEAIVPPGPRVPSKSVMMWLD